MPVVSDVPLEISLAELKRLRTLHGKDGLHPRLRALLPEILAEAVGQKVLQPAVAWESRRLLEATGTRVRLAGGPELARAKAVVELLGEADELVAAVGSIGPELDLMARDWSASGRELDAFVLGEIGNLAIGKLADRMPEIISEWAAGRGLEASGALSPGGTGVDLSDQRVVVELANAQRIGVDLTSGQMLVPLKSMSLLIGLGHGLPTWTHAQACDLCASREHCRLRRSNSEPAVA
ncbi:MAG: hypothetical protein GY772_16790 [bacterium]|nr:hypothetical protein [Deltaproteobacteria bacterium]MCP4242214.1 hypothetical protein [bacterium]MDP7571381.1 hypothetical protein [Myxococcota bacterium]HJO23673.1 hypothetical protein [Myxococcota bacterium]